MWRMWSDITKLRLLWATRECEIYIMARPLVIIDTHLIPYVHVLMWVGVLIQYAIFTSIFFREDETDVVFPKDECKPLSTLCPPAVPE